MKQAQELDLGYNIRQEINHMLVENPFGILEDNKKYKNPHSGEIRTGKEWVKLFEESEFEIFYNDDLRSMMEIKEF